MIKFYFMMLIEDCHSSVRDSEAARNCTSNNYIASGHGIL